MNPQPSAQQSQQSIRAANAQARALVTQNAVKLTQQIYSTTVTPGTTNVLNIAPRNVGLILGFWIELSGNQATTSGTGTLTQFGMANALSSIVFTDLKNYTRHQTTGWHLHMVNSVKAKGQPFGSAATLSTYPINWGYNWTGIIAAPATITTTTATSMLYWLPLAYSDFDLRGAIYGAVVNATMNLQLTINLSTFQNTGDATLAIYSGANGVTTNGNGWVSTVTVNVYQVYYDQLPKVNGNVILPKVDLATVYELKTTTVNGLAANQDFQIPYSNFRDFLSTVAIYDVNGTLGIGADINYWALQAANFVNIWKVDPQLATAMTRNSVGDDPPKGTYYFDSRAKPISTTQYGNLNLVINPITVTAPTNIYVGYEDFAIQNALLNASGLANS